MTADGAPFSFYIVKLGKGWMDFHLSVDNTIYDLTVASVFSEPVRDLCDCLSDALSDPSNGCSNGNTPHFEFEWLGEGWLYEWGATLTARDRLDFSVAFSGNREEGGIKYPVWSVDFQVSPVEFAKQVWQQCGSLLRNTGFTEYRAQWGKDFPLAQLLSLGSQLSAGQGAPVREELDLLRELISS